MNEDEYLMNLREETIRLKETYWRRTIGMALQSERLRAQELPAHCL